MDLVAVFTATGEALQHRTCLIAPVSHEDYRLPSHHSSLRSTLCQRAGGRPSWRRAIAWPGRAGGFVSVRRAKPGIPKPDKKLARVFVGSFLSACRALRRLLPTISELFPNDGFRPLTGM